MRNGCVKGRKIEGLDVCDKVEIWNNLLDILSRRISYYMLTSRIFHYKARYLSSQDHKKKVSIKVCRCQQLLFKAVVLGRFGHTIRRRSLRKIVWVCSAIKRSMIVTCDTLLRFLQWMFINTCVINLREKKEEIWLSPMTKAPTPTEQSKKQRGNTKTPPKLRLHNNCGPI